MRFPTAFLLLATCGMALAEPPLPQAPAGEFEFQDGMGDLDAAAEMRIFEPAKAEGLGRILQKLHKPSYGWFYGLDAALGSWTASPAAGAAPMTYNLNRAMDPTYWKKALTPGQPELRDSLFLFSSDPTGWLQHAAGIPGRAPGACAVLSPPVVVAHGQAIHLPQAPEVDAFLRQAARERRDLDLYLPVNASALTGSGHYILAVAELRPQAQGHYRMKMKFYDSLMSGRSSLFRRNEEEVFTLTLNGRLNGLLGDLASVAYQRSEDEYHQVRSQMPGTTHCGRYITLYTFAHMMRIPYREWYQERFNRVLPEYMRVFEGR